MAEDECADSLVVVMQLQLVLGQRLRTGGGTVSPESRARTTARKRREVVGDCSETEFNIASCSIPPSSGNGQALSEHRHQRHCSDVLLSLSVSSLSVLVWRLLRARAFSVSQSSACDTAIMMYSYTSGTKKEEQGSEQRLTPLSPRCSETAAEKPRRLGFPRAAALGLRHA